MTSYKPTAEEEEYITSVQYPYRYFEMWKFNGLLYISIIILIAMPLNIIVRKFRIPAGDRVIMLLISLLYIYFYQLEFFLEMNIFSYITPIHKLTWLLPLLQFRNMFLMELYIIKKARFELFIISIICNTFVILGTAVSLAKLVLDDTSMLASLLFSTVLTCVEGCDSFKRVKEMERNKHLLIILETESLVGYTLFLTSFHVIIRTYEGLLDTWQSQLLFTLRYVGGGIVCGFVLGKISGWLLSLVYNDSFNSLVVCLFCTYFFYSVSEYILLVSGPIVSFMVSMNLSTVRKKLTAEAVVFIRNFTEILMYTTSFTIFIVVCSRLIYMTIYYHPRQRLTYVAFSYCFVIVLRIVSLLMAYPILCRIGYCMDLPSCTFYGWAGSSRGPISLALAEIAYRNKYSGDSFHAAMPHILATVILSIIINYSTYALLLRKLGFFTISTLRRGNMQNCIDYLNGTKWTLLTILKMASRLMTDTNYPIVYKYTVINNPYRRHGGNADEDEYEEKQINELGLRDSKCPWCNRDISMQPTAKEITENLLEARLRLLKTQKVAFIRQYELGMLSKDAVRFLLHLVEAAMESHDLVVKLDEFYKIFYVKNIYNYARAVAEFMYGRETIKIPKEKIRLICYRIVTHFGFECFMYALIIIVTMPFIFRHFVTHLYDRIKIWITWSSCIVLVIFLLEIVAKIYAFSSDGFYEGLRTYFRSKWNMLDFCVVSVHMVVTFIGAFNGWYNVHEHDANEGITFRYVAINFNDGFKILRLFRIFRFLSASCISKCNHKINSRISYGYDIGKVIIITYSDLAETLYQITENPDIISIIKSQLDTDRDAVNITLEDVIKLKPSVPVQVKTKQAIRSTLNHMRVIAIELKKLGYVDNLEFDEIMGRLYERNRAVKALGKIKPSSPKTIFMELPFMISEDAISAVLFSQAEVVTWETNELIINDFDDGLGIYVLLQGVLRITYIPNQNVVDNLINHGILPIVDYVSPFRSDMPVEEFIFPGNSFGELAVLTQRKYNCRIQADSKSRAIFLSVAKLEEAMKISCDPVQGLATRIWKYVVMECATAILRISQVYHKVSLDQIRMTIERSFVPDLPHYRTFIVTDLMEDLLLLEGIVADANNGDVYVAPCYLPRTVQKLALHNDSNFNMDVKVYPKLLIIPMKDVDEYEIMERAEDMAELIENPPDYLLVHKYRKLKTKKQKKGGGGGSGGGLIGLSKRRRMIDFSSMSQARSRTLSQASTTRSAPSITLKEQSGESESDVMSRESGASQSSTRVTYQPSPENIHSEENREVKKNEPDLIKKSNEFFVSEPLIEKTAEEIAIEDSKVKEIAANYLLQIIKSACSIIENSILHPNNLKLDEADELVENVSNVTLLKEDKPKKDSRSSKVHLKNVTETNDETTDIEKHLKAEVSLPIQPNAEEESGLETLDNAKYTEETPKQSESKDNEVQTKPISVITSKDYIQSITNDLLKNVCSDSIKNIDLPKSKDKQNIPAIEVGKRRKSRDQVDIPRNATKRDGAVDESKIKDKQPSKYSGSLERNKQRISKDDPATRKPINKITYTLEDSVKPRTLKKDRLSSKNNHEGVEGPSGVNNTAGAKKKHRTDVESLASFESKNKDQKDVKGKRKLKDSHSPKHDHEEHGIKKKKKKPKTKPKDDNNK